MMTEPIRKVAIVGLGLIGGSLARALAARGVRIAGYDSDTAHLDAAIADGVVSERLSPSLEEVTDSDAVVIAIHSDRAGDLLETVEPYADKLQLVTDVGSTKRAIVENAGRLNLASRFVGSHPFAGDHRSGWRASRGDLFENQTVYLCRTPKTGAAAFEFAMSLWQLVGASPLEMTAAEHDRLLGWTSHLPHVVSTALALALAHAGIGHNQLGRGGRDVTRLAGGSKDVWEPILLENAEAVDAGIAGVQSKLDELREVLRLRDRKLLGALLEKGTDWSSSSA